MSTTHSFEHKVETVRFSLTDHFDKILSMVIDRDRCKLPQDTVLALGSGPLHIEFCKFSKFHQGGSHTTARAIDEHFITSLDLCHAVQHLVCRNIIQN